MTMTSRKRLTLESSYSSLRSQVAAYKWRGRVSPIIITVISSSSLSYHHHHCHIIIIMIIKIIIMAWAGQSHHCPIIIIIVIIFIIIMTPLTWQLWWCDREADKTVMVFSKIKISLAQYYSDKAYFVKKYIDKDFAKKNIKIRILHIEHT